MKRLPLLVTARKAASRVLNAVETTDGPMRGAAVRAREAATTLAEALTSLQWPKRPDVLNIELTAICDARCIHCPRHDMDRSQRPMDLGLFKRIVDQAAELRVPQLSPNGYGELLTMRNLEEYLAYARSKSHRFSILVNTNGFRLDAEKRRLFLDYEVDLLNVTLDGATAETFEAIRVNLGLSQIEENVHALLAERKERGATLPRVRIGMIVIPQNEHEVQALLDKWHGVADYVGAARFTNRAGSLDATFQSDGQPQAAHACVLPFRELTIWADGNAVLCCDDWNEEHKVGDLNASSLADVWHGVALRHARKMHREGKGDTLAICARCNYWREPVSLARLWT